VNFHEVNKQCELTKYYPLDNTTSGIPNNGWKMFFRRNFGKRFIYTLRIKSCVIVSEDIIEKNRLGR
jgi:hypothetical protein